MTGMLLETTASRAIEALPSLALAMLAPTPEDSLAEKEAYAATLSALALETTYANALHVHNSLCDLLMVPPVHRDLLARMALIDRLRQDLGIEPTVRDLIAATL